MKIVITGAGGVLGQMLARALIARGGIAREPGAKSDLTELVLVDRVFPPERLEDSRVQYETGDVGDVSLLRRVVAADTGAVFHLAAVVSAGAEADFDLGMGVNVDGTRAVLEAGRRLAAPPRLVFTSSVAAFGGDLPNVVLDWTAATPQSSYGTQKVIGELLVNDYSRKGYSDGRTVRLPTIVVRPGKPNRAASGFMSSILREPLNGEPALCPVPADTRMWILSPERAVDALIHAVELPGAALGANRTINAPGVTVSVAQALAALERIAGRETAARVRIERDPSTEKIVLSWPAA
ncbi:MAG: NAD-dependent epimerase/dehydratase family protein, partial [Betaproteobacteria bacterium]|nr:NAD-dependent epimerase/dehydratase family protein [Betaproteobacteria bacterium]